MSENGDNAAAVRVPEIFKNKPTTNDARRKQRAEWRVRAMMAEAEALLREYFKNPQDFVMYGMLSDVRRLNRVMERSEQAMNRETDPSKCIAHGSEITKTSKAHLVALQAIAKYQESTYHARVKEARRNRSAAPGQQVGNPQSTNENTVCSNPSASSSAASS